MIRQNELKQFLDLKVAEFETPDFLAEDPLGVIHQVKGKENKEIMGFLVSTFAWGQRKSIIQNAYQLYDILEENPIKILKNFTPFPEKTFTHRTFNTQDLNYFLERLSYIYENDGGLENIFTLLINEKGMKKALISFHSYFFPPALNVRSKKHISNPAKGSAAKRINMYLRWMIRSNSKGVDLGLWHHIKPSHLRIPLDVHTSRTAAILGLSQRKADDWKKLEEIHKHLDLYDPYDPAKYDFALFGLSKFEDWQ